MTNLTHAEWAALAFGIDPKMAPVELNSGQFEGMIALKPFLARGENAYVEMPPGSGKTGLFLSLAEILYMLPGTAKPRILILTMSEHLRTQIAEEAKKFAPRLYGKGGVLELDEGKKLPKSIPPITIATYDMAVSLLKSGAISMDQYDVLFKDEGHTSLSELRQSLLISKVAEHVRQIAFTATPEYYVEKSLNEAGFREAYRLSIAEAQKRKILAGHKNVLVDIDDLAFSLEGIDVNSNDGDWDPIKTEKIINQARLNHLLAEFLLTWKDPISGRALKDMVGIVACNSVAHARDFAGVLNQRRLAVDFDPQALCMPVWGTMPGTARKKLIASHQDGSLRSLACEKLLLVGYDNPLIEYIINIAPTRSMVRAGQRGGRVLRQFRSRKNKTGYIFDIVYPGARDDQICFGDFEGQFALHNPPPRADETDPTLPPAEVKEKVEAYLGKSPSFQNVRVHYTDGQVRKYVRTRAINRAIERYPTLRGLCPSIRDGMILRNIYSVSEFAAKVCRHPAIVQWKLDNPRANYLISEAAVSRFVKDENRQYWRQSFDDRYSNMYHPAAVAIATFLDIPPKQIFGALPDVANFEFSRARIEYFERAGTIDAAKPLPEKPIIPPTVDEVLLGHYLDSRESSSPYDEQGEPLDVVPLKLSRFPFPPGIGATKDEKDILNPLRPIDPDWSLTRQDLVGVMREILTSLTAREERVIRSRFGFKCDEQSLEEIGNLFGVTRERIRQIEAKALRKMKHPSRSRTLKKFLDHLDT